LWRDLSAIEKIEYFGFVLPKIDEHNLSLYNCTIAIDAPLQNMRSTPSGCRRATVTRAPLAARLRATSKARIANLRRDNARRS
jgi:hypothetical protein